MTSSFSAIPTPNRNAILINGKQKEKPVFFGYLLAFVGVCALVLLGDPNSVSVQGAALLLAGFTVCIRPPKYAFGKGFNRSVLFFLGCLALTFLPQFYWFSQDWRIGAAAVGVDLPFMLTVHPMMSFETVLLLLAGISWFYSLAGLKLNSNGRRFFYFVFSLFVSLYAGFILWAYTYSHSGVLDPKQLYSFLGDHNQVGAILALSGLLSFAYMVEGLRVRDLLHLFGGICSSLCLVALLIGGYSFGVVVYTLGITVWYLVRLSSKAIPRSFKYIFPVLLASLISYIYVNDHAVDWLVKHAAFDETDASISRVAVYQDALSAFADAPIAGSGVGTFETVFSQYQKHSIGATSIHNPQSNLLVLLVEMGLLGLAALIGMLYFYLKCCRNLSLGRGGPYRVIALITAMSFLLYCVLGNPGDRVGVLFFALLLAAFAMPSTEGRHSRFMPLYWRLAGVSFIVFGAVWMIAVSTNAPFHSKIAIPQYFENAAESEAVNDYGSAIQSMDRIINWNPMLWEPYVDRASYELELGTDIRQVEADFERASYVDPNSGQSSIREGYIWSSKDTRRAVSAWQKGLSRELTDNIRAFELILAEAAENPSLMRELLPLTKMKNAYRAHSFRYMPSAIFNQEITKEFAEDRGLKKYTTAERFTIISYWMRYGDLEDIEQYLEDYATGVDYGWWLRSLLMKERAEFDGALLYAREGMDPPELPEVEYESSEAVRLAREFSVSPDDMTKGMHLLSIHLGNGDLESALTVADAMLVFEHAPAAVHYWRGELLYQLDDVIESWYAFSNYVHLAYTDDFIE